MLTFAQKKDNPMRKVLFMMLVAALSVLPLAAPYAGLLCADGRYAVADGRYAVADGPVGVGSVPGMSFPAAVDKTRPFLFGTGNANADVCCLSGACDDARCSEVNTKSAQSRREVGAKSARSRREGNAKSAQRRHEVGAKSTQSQREGDTKLTRSRREVDDRQHLRQCLRNGWNGGIRGSSWFPAGHRQSGAPLRDEAWFGGGHEKSHLPFVNETRSGSALDLR